MLAVTITNRNGVQRVYDDELVKFSWLTRNNEGTSFSASVPSLSAAITICKVDGFLKGLDRKAKIVVTSDVAGGLELPLSIIEVSSLKKRGTTEISCTGNFFTQTNNIWGTLKIPAAQWADTQAAYGLEMVESHEANGDITMNVEKKEDIALAVAWSFNTRRNVSITPFTSGRAGAFENDGIGLFKNVKETDTVDDYAPVYRVRAADIVEYNIEAAQPPVTHIQTTTLGKLGPTPQIPAISVAKYSGNPGSIDIDDNVRSFYIEELQIGAIYSAQEDTAGTIVAQQLTWSDGFSNTWASSQRRKILGIFRDGYAEIDPTDNTRIAICDRETGTVTQTLAIGTDVSALWENTNSQLSARVTNVITIGDDTYSVLWFKKAMTNGANAMYGIASSGLRNNRIMFEQTSLYGGYFVGSCKMKGADDELVLQAVFYTSGQTVARRSVSLNGAILSSSIVLPAIASLPDFDYSGQVQAGAVIEPLDFIGVKQVPGTSTLSYTLWKATSASDTQVVCDWFTSSTAGIKFVRDATSQVHWVVDKGAVAPVYGNTPMLFEDLEGAWTLEKDTNTSSTATTFTVLQQGSVKEWAGESLLFSRLYRGAFVGVIYRGDSYWDVYLQMSAVPYISRQRGDLSVSQMIAEGNTNIVQLPFKVGALQQADALTWDKDLGRIELTISKFEVRNNLTQQWVEKDIQALNIMAMSAYAKVWLDPEDADDIVTVKVTGFSLDYEGQLIAKLSGIVVE